MSWDGQFKSHDDSANGTEVASRGSAAGSRRLAAQTTGGPPNKLSGSQCRPRVLVLGATGRIGSKVIAELERFNTARVVYPSRKLALVEAWRRDGKDAVRLDLDPPETFPERPLPAVLSAAWSKKFPPPSGFWALNSFFHLTGALDYN